jgi:thiol-disulfide isomerase/thioredoxin
MVKVVNDGPEIYLEPGAYVRIKGEGRYFQNARISSPVKDQQLRDRFMSKMSQEDWKALQDITAHRDAIVRETYEAGISPERRDSLRKLAQEELNERNKINDRLSQQKLQLLETEEIGSFALHQLNLQAVSVSQGKKENREAVLALYERLSDEQKASPDGMEILNYINPVKTLNTGDSLPPYAYVDKNGKTVQLDAFRGRWVLLDFWSRGCGPCIKAVPELGAVSKEFQDKLSVVSISLDRENTWKEASAEHGIFWNDWNDPKGSAGSVRVFGTTGIPTFVILTPEGSIHQVLVGYGEGVLRNAIRKALDN